MTDQTSGSGTLRSVRRVFVPAYLFATLLLVTVVAPRSGSAQQSDTRSARIDSLESIIGESTGTRRIGATVDLGRLLLSTDPDRTMELADAALDEAESVGDSAGVGRALALRSVQQYFSGEYEAALAGYQRGLDAAASAGDATTQVLILNDMGTLEKKLGDLDEALELFERGLAVASAAADSGQIANSMNNMGIVYDVRGDPGRAMKYFRESAGIKERLGDLNGLTYNLDNMGMVSSRQGRYAEAESFFMRAADIRRSLGDERGYGIVLNNIGEMYLLKGDYERALPYFERALEIARATSYTDFEQYIHGKISDVNAARGNHEAALAWYKSGTALRDSLFNADRNRQLTEMQTRYETQKKEQTIALQEAEIQAQKADLQRNYILLGALVLLTGLIAIAYYLRKAKEQLRIREAEMNASIASQERERRRIAQDLHDGLGQLITTARMHVQSESGGKTPESGAVEPSASSPSTANHPGPNAPISDMSKNRRARPPKTGRVSGDSATGGGDSSELDDTAAGPGTRAGGVSDEMLREMHREVRNIAFNLMPATLVRKGVTEAIDELGRRAADSGTVSINVQAHGLDGRQPEYWEIAVYRIAQEWLSNILQYASADSVDIQITGHQDEIILMIEDDGVGLDVERLRSGSGSGWSNIQSRARQVNGIVHIDSNPRAGGTTFILRTPVPVDQPVGSLRMHRA